VPKKPKSNHLKVVTFDDSPDKPHTDPNTGNPVLFTIKTSTDLMPEVPIEFKPFADYMNHQLKQSKNQNRGLKSELKKTTEKFERVGNTVERLISKLEDKIVSNKNPDLVISPYLDDIDADVLLVATTLPAEAFYPHLTLELSQLIGMNPSRLGKLFGLSGIKGNPKFHHEKKTGRNSTCQEYKKSALDELYKRASEQTFEGMKPHEYLQLESYLKVKDSIQ
jgi:hypothetical protein